ncbi:unnamed protein product [Gongylonema pulchrum]|uniref:Uncharacterized protein n=1 Tax=Gongylonema pulchrum TaxID=637853 RepID=A0A3P7PA13_9BILA|nr:unnamed protein product [Gongylonema pulchrum]
MTHRMQWLRDQVRAHVARQAVLRIATLWSELTFRRRFAERQQHAANDEPEDHIQRDVEDMDQDDNAGYDENGQGWRRRLEEGEEHK